jgi:hypothetical protein
MSEDLEKTKKLMGSLVRMKPKSHEEMKVGKKKAKKKRASKTTKRDPAD